MLLALQAEMPSRKRALRAARPATSTLDTKSKDGLDGNESPPTDGLSQAQQGCFKLPQLLLAAVCLVLVLIVLNRLPLVLPVGFGSPPEVTKLVPVSDATESVGGRLRRANELAAALEDAGATFHAPLEVQRIGNSEELGVRVRSYSIYVVYSHKPRACRA
eukprot:SAG11_NODE_2939_length_2822_cov_79.228792_3_plen_161_part_00